MILIACTSCGFTLRVEASAKDGFREFDTLVGKSSEYWPDKYTCPECGKSARAIEPGGVTAEASGRLRIVDVTVPEAFAALEGLGLPKERSCRLEDVIELMKKHGVKNLSGKDIVGSSRCVIDYIELVDGSKVYLAPSTDGATVYRVTKPHYYAAEVKDA